MAENIDKPVTGEVMPKREETVRPPLDIFEDGDGITLLADLPGVSRDAINLQVQDNVLMLEARPTHRIDGKAIYREFNLVKFERQIPIPETYDTTQIKAELSRGVLRLHLPKTESAKPKQIPVTVS
jgi:HSP20 family molecular chaperone IbpA